jgi:GNAT superfamily N-acetyltransferase
MNGNISYRLARDNDLSAMRVIQSTALQHLAVTREGRDPSVLPISDQPSLQMRHLLRTDPKLAWLAIEDDRPIGFSMGFVRSELWFLSDLFVLPEAHGKGIGNALLQRCLEGGLRRGARIRAVASSNDPGAQSLYIRAGMVPRFPLFGLEGMGQRLRDLPGTKPAIERPSASRIWLGKLGALDEQIWGRRRDREHRFWRGEFAMTCLAIVDRSGELLAYGYYEPRRIGPVVARSAPLQLSILHAIGDALGDGADQPVELRLPGINIVALQALLEVGFRIDHIGMYMASRTFGRFDRYMPSGGTLL